MLPSSANFILLQGEEKRKKNFESEIYIFWAQYRLHPLLSLDWLTDWLTGDPPTAYHPSFDEFCTEKSSSITGLTLKEDQLEKIMGASQTSNVLALSIIVY